MGDLSTKCTIEVPVSTVYECLKATYTDSRFLDSSKETKGYIPTIELKEDQRDRKLHFRVAGRDGLTKIKTSSWEWQFILDALAPTTTRVTISYTWSLGLSVLGLGTVGLQAANQMTDNVRLLIALERGFAAAEVAPPVLQG